MVLYGPASPTSGYMGDERAKGAQACSGTEWHCVGQQAGHGGVDFLDKNAFVLFVRLLRLLAESTRSRHDVFTRFVRLQADSMEKSTSLHMPGNDRLYLPPSNATQHYIFSRWPQCLVKTQLQTSVK